MEGEEPCVSFLFSHFDSFFSSDKLSLGKGVQEGQRVKVFFFLSNFQLLPPPLPVFPFYPQRRRGRVVKVGFGGGVDLRRKAILFLPDQKKKVHFF
jgi:hypothetical protein